jgi:dienelactone hydrolase
VLVWNLLTALRLADSIASNGYLVLVPDLFAGDPVGVEEQEAGLNLTEWRALHPQSAIEAVINITIHYARHKLNIEKLGGVGYCFGGKYVGRWLKGDDSGLDVGFVAHPSNLLETEIQAIAGPLSIAAGSKFTPRYLGTASMKANNISTRRKLQCHGEVQSRKHFELEQHHLSD